MNKNNTQVLFLPFPPSVNTYWGFSGHRRFLTKKAVYFKSEVALEVYNKKIKFDLERLEVMITLFPPDKRIRDLDNFAKSTLDALCQAKCFVDDSQIDLLILRRGSIYKGGKAEVAIKII
jgi:crossover junction endodeoxyribonuclease RusA